MFNGILPRKGDFDKRVQKKKSGGLDKFLGVSATKNRNGSVSDLNKFPAPQALPKSRLKKPCGQHQIRDRKCSFCGFAKATLTADFLSGKLEHIAAADRTIPPSRFTPIVCPLPRGVSASYEQIGNSSRTSLIVGKHL
jgi:hypothetical protein